MNYIVIDLEWNQPIHTNVGNSESKNYEKTRICKDMQFEIIEIGAVKLNENFQEIGRFNRLVKPSLYKKMNPIISEITGIRENEFHKAGKFKTVIRNFLDWCGEDYIICTFGNQDIHELEINMHYHKCEIPWKFPLKYIDIQKIFGIENNEPNEQRSLEMVSIYMGVEQKKVYHRALSDAVYTAEIMKKMNRESFEKYQSLDYINLPKTKKEEVEINLGNHMECLSRGFDSKEEVINYKDIYITRCPVCLKKCRKKIRWFADINKYLCVARCENHGLMEGILYIKNNYNGYYALRKTFQIDDEKYKVIADRKNLLREKRKIKRNK